MTASPVALFIAFHMFLNDPTFLLLDITLIRASCAANERNFDKVESVDALSAKICSYSKAGKFSDMTFLSSEAQISTLSSSLKQGVMTVIFFMLPLRKIL